MDLKTSTFNCPNCGTELDAYKEKLMCLKHQTVYCTWCAIDRDGNCEEEGDCYVEIHCPF